METSDKELIEMLRPLAELGRRHLQQLHNKEAEEEMIRQSKDDAIALNHRWDLLSENSLVVLKEEASRRLSIPRESVDLWAKSIIHGLYEEYNEDGYGVGSCSYGDELRHGYTVEMHGLLGVKSFIRFRASEEHETLESLANEASVLPDEFEMFVMLRKRFPEQTMPGEQTVTENTGKSFWQAVRIWFCG